MMLSNQFQLPWKQHKSAKFQGPSAQYAFAKDLGSSSLIFLASFDRQFDLKEKLMVQASGISYLVATYSDAFIMVVILAKMHFQKLLLLLMLQHHWTAIATRCPQHFSEATWVLYRLVLLPRTFMPWALMRWDPIHAHSTAAILVQSVLLFCIGTHED
jgi:hypothetical protein